MDFTFFLNNTEHELLERYRRHKAQWLLYVPLGLTLKLYMLCPCITFVCSLWILEQIAGVFSSTALTD
jgi:hypothetical protein